MDPCNDINLTPEMRNHDGEAPSFVDILKKRTVIDLDLQRDQRHRDIMNIAFDSFYDDMHRYDGKSLPDVPSLSPRDRSSRRNVTLLPIRNKRWIQEMTLADEDNQLNDDWVLKRIIPVELYGLVSCSIGSAHQCTSIDSGVGSRDTEPNQDNHSFESSSYVQRDQASLRCSFLSLNNKSEEYKQMSSSNLRSRNMPRNAILSIRDGNESLYVSDESNETCIGLVVKGLDKPIRPKAVCSPGHRLMDFSYSSRNFFSAKETAAPYPVGISKETSPLGQDDNCHSWPYGHLTCCISFISLQSTSTSRPPHSYAPSFRLFEISFHPRHIHGSNCIVFSYIIY